MNRLLKKWGIALAVLMVLALGGCIHEPEVHVHTFETVWSKNETNHWHQATCGHEVQDALGAHEWDEGVVTKASTCGLEGVKTYTCTVCDSTKTESIAATGVHTWDDGVITKAPCIQEGERTYTCAVCSSTKTESIAATGLHSYNGTSVCTICGYEKDFVLLEASSQNPISFSMGCTAGMDSEKNVHTVNLTRSYWICDHEVTQDEYKAVTESNPSDFSSIPAYGEVQGKRPVEYVSWFDAIVYCNKRSVQEGLEPCYSIQDSQGNYTTDTSLWGEVPISDTDTNYDKWNQAQCNFDATGYRLPTEAEWEYAARGGSSVTDSRIYSGTTSSSSLGTYAWYDRNSSSITHQVKTKNQNAYGLYDMSGNVDEWCWDWYESSYSTSAQTDPVGAGSGFSRVKRGGSWDYYSGACSVSYRNRSSSYDRNSRIGFRVVRSSSK